MAEIVNGRVHLSLAPERLRSFQHAAATQQPRFLVFFLLLNPWGFAETSGRAGVHCR